MTEPKKYLIYTFGCQMNERDSETLAGFCEGLGYVPGDDLGRADLIILNTCCVRENAENRVYGHLGNLKPLKDSRPDAVIAVCGCMGQDTAVRERIKFQFPQVDLIMGPQNLHDFPRLLQRVLSGEERVIEVDPGPGRIHEGLPAKRRDALKAWVNIIHGCDNFCSYCIVPYVRGRERSRRPDDILTEIEELTAAGIREVTLLGQNVNSYGRDLEQQIDFAALLRRIEELPNLYRVRFMTSHPKDLSDDLITAMADCDKVCEHLHLPVQSGSDRTLAAMNRRYDRSHYLGLIERLRRAVPEIVLTTDIIVGFPGEAETDFQDTLDLVRQVRYDAAFTFAYSPRLGTKAADLPDHLPVDVKQERLSRLIELQNGISRYKNEALRGQTLEVMVEGPSEKNPAVWCGRTRGNKLALFPGPAQAGDLVMVKIAEPRSWTLHGEIVKQAMLQGEPPKPSVDHLRTSGEG